MKNVRLLHFNWHQVGSTETRDGAGEDYNYYEVGRDGCISIVEHTTNNVFSYTVILEDEHGNKKEPLRVFNPNLVRYIE